MSSLPPRKPKQIPVHSRTEAELSELQEYPLSSLDYRLQLSLFKKVKRQDTQSSEDSTETGQLI